MEQQFSPRCKSLASWVDIIQFWYKMIQNNFNVESENDQIVNPKTFVQGFASDRKTHTRIIISVKHFFD